MKTIKGTKTKVAKKINSKKTKVVKKKVEAKRVNKKISHVIFLLDQTGSMYNILKDTIGGFNSFLEEQKKLKNNISFSLILFNSQRIDKRYVDVDINDVSALDENTYIPTGLTPLYDAIGLTIKDVDHLKDALFVILTDGEENFSREYTSETIKAIIEDKEKIGWKFLFLGVDLKDYEKHSDRIGIRAAVGTNSINTIDTYNKMSKTVSAYATTSNTSTFDAKDEFNKS